LYEEVGCQDDKRGKTNRLQDDVGVGGVLMKGEGFRQRIFLVFVLVWSIECLTILMAGVWGQEATIHALHEHTPK
jgi:hypothetical protein